MGSPLFDGYRPRFDAASVQGLRESGAVILGKTVTQNSPSPTHGGRATLGPDPQARRQQQWSAAA